MIMFCPGCAKEITEGDEACPFCGRDFRVPAKSDDPMFRAADTPAARKLSPRPLLGPGRMNRSSLALAAAAFAAAAFWLPRRSPPRREPPRASAPEPERAVPLPRAMPESPYEQSVEVAPAPALPAEETASVRPARRKKTRPERPVFLESMTSKESSSEWRIRGVVFDLLTLRPVAEAEVVFNDPATGQRFPTATDALGRYRAHLPVSETGYALMISHPSYQPKYTQDESGSLRRMRRADRSALAVQVSNTLQYKEMYKGRSGQVQERDFALIPAAR